MVQPVAFPMFPLWGLQNKERNKTKPTKQPPPFAEGNFGKRLGKALVVIFTFPPVCAFQLTREFFTKELKKHYLRNNDTDVFSSTWNSVMITVSPAVPRSHAAHGQQPPTRCSALTLSSLRVSLLQPSCRIKRSAGVCGGGGMETKEFGWQPVFLKAVSPERDAPSDCISLCGFPKTRGVWPVGTPGFQRAGTESCGAVSNWASLRLPWTFHLADYFRTIPS